MNCSLAFPHRCCCSGASATPGSCRRAPLSFGAAPESTTEVVLEAGHCPHDEVPEQVNAALVSWLESLEASPVSSNTSNLEPSL